MGFDLNSIFGTSPKQVQAPTLEEFEPWIQAQIDANRVDQVTPFGQTTYSYPNAEQAMSFEDWAIENPGTTTEVGGYWKGGDPGNTRPSDREWIPGTMESTGPNRNDYYDYVSNLDRGDQVAETSFSPEVQNLFTEQFDPNAYQHYADDYMAESERLLTPIYDRQTEQMQQAMANRGQPVGSELYSDTYGDILDAQNRSWESAAFNAKGAGENARLQDWNRLMSAMGMSTVDVPPVDVMSPANMALNLKLANQETSNNNSSNLWNTLAGLGGAYAIGAPDDSWLWGDTK